jgi:lysine decarboxylase
MRRALGDEPFRGDVLSTAGLDDRKASHGYLQTAQELMADAVGADQAFFSTCGSSLSIKAVMLAVTRGEGEIIITRDSHKSVTSGLVLSGLQPRWIRPGWDRDQSIAHPPSVESLETMWERYPDASAALVVSPTPYGTCADIAAMAEVCHRRGKPLVVDEAWGAHLPFSPELPTWAMNAGADVCVTSVHKMGLGFEQGSVFHLQGGLVDPVRLRQCADVLSTTSPNVLIYAGLDGWRHHMAMHGERLLHDTLELTRRTRDEIATIPGIAVLEEELLANESVREIDPLHVLMDLQQLGISGYQAADWLREHERIDIGTNDHRHIEATLSIADDDDTVARLIDALRHLVEAAPELPASPPVQLPSPEELELETAMLPRDAFFGPVEVVPVAEAAGRISAEQITPYPPGIPAALPGERLNQAVVDYLTSGVGAGMELPDPGDPTLQTIRVAREELSR